MVQVVTISANTAAYAAEPLKASARVSGSSPSEQTMKALAAQTRKTGDFQQKALMNIVQPPALALFFLTADKDHPQTTLEMARAAYLAANSEDDEKAAADDEAVGHPIDPA